MNIGNKILILISERIGDTIFCTPAIHLLRQTKPDALIDILTLSNFSAQAFESNSDINNLYIQPTKNETKQLRNQYETIIDLHHSNETKQYLKWLNQPAFITPRTAKNFTHQSEVATQFIQALLFCHNIKEAALSHDFIMECLHKNANLPMINKHYRLFPQDHHIEQAKQLLLENGATLEENEILVGCHMGNYKTARRMGMLFKKNIYSKRTWPVEKFAELQSQLFQLNPNIKLVLTGSKSEKPLAEKLYTNIDNTINLIGKTNLLELAALMKFFKIFVTGDTGPQHVATTMDIPLIALFGPSVPERTGPYPLKDYHHIIHKNPLSELQVEPVKMLILKYC